MAFGKSFLVGLDERGVLFDNGVPVRVLLPGAHSVSFWRDGTVKLYPLNTPLGDPAPPMHTDG